MSDKKNDEMTRRVAIFRDQKYGGTTTWDLRGHDDSYRPSSGDYVRISEWMTATFKPLSREELTAAELDALSQLRAKTVEEFTEKLNFIDGRMANLRALTGPEDAA